MIEALKRDDVHKKVGGAFKLTALIQRRLVELLQGARPMVETQGLTEIEVVIKEIMEEKIAPSYYESGSEHEDAEE